MRGVGSVAARHAGVHGGVGGVRPGGRPRVVVVVRGARPVQPGQRGRGRGPREPLQRRRRLVGRGAGHERGRGAGGRPQPRGCRDCEGKEEKTSGEIDVQFEFKIEQNCSSPWHILHAHRHTKFSQKKN